MWFLFFWIIVSVISVSVALSEKENPSMKVPVWLATIVVTVLGALLGYWGYRVDQRVDSLDDKLNDPKTGLPVLQERLRNHINYHTQAGKLFESMYRNPNASEAHKAILIKDAALFQLNPEIFLETHVKNMPWLKEYDGQVKDFSNQMKTMEYTPPK